MSQTILTTTVADDQREAIEDAVEIARKAVALDCLCESAALSLALQRTELVPNAHVADEIAESVIARLSMEPEASLDRFSKIVSQRLPR